MTGIKFDQGKAPLSLIDPRFTEEVARVLAIGEQKYGRANWQGLKVERLLDAVKRHTLELEKSNDHDDETGLHHAAHAASGLMFIYWLLNNRPESDDRRWGMSVGSIPAVPGVRERQGGIQPVANSEKGLDMQPVPTQTPSGSQKRAYSTGTIADVQKLISGWADRTFPDRTIGEAILKLKKELAELDTASYLDAGEFADVAILLFDVAHLSGIDISTAVENKMAINERRVWQRLEDGTHQHVIDGGRTDGVDPIIRRVSLGDVDPVNHAVESRLCVVCGRRFPSERDRATHYQTEHGRKK